MYVENENISSLLDWHKALAFYTEPYNFKTKYTNVAGFDLSYTH